MAREYQPHPYQKIGIDFLLTHNRCNFFAGMGMGKTSTCLSVLSSLKVLGETPALVIAPKHVAENVWPLEAQKWEHTKHLKIANMAGLTQAKRAKAFFINADIYTINYEQLGWLEKTIRLSKRCFKTIIADESTRLKGFRLKGGGRRALSLKHFAFTSNRFINLSGTPSPNGLQDLWGQMYFIDSGKRLGNTFTAFKDRWFEYDNPFSTYPKLCAKEHADSQISAAMSDVTLTLLPEDWFDLRKPIEYNINAFLPAKAKELYDEMEKKLYIELSRGPVEATTAAVKSIKVLQMASGCVYYKDKMHEILHEAKLDALESIIEENPGENILLAYHWQFDLEMIKRRFPYAVDIKEKHAVDEWNKGNIRLLCAHPQSAGHGLNLQYGGRALVNYSHWWAAEPRQQILERIGPVRQLQAGLNRNVYIYNIVGYDTLDYTVLESHKNKQSIQNAILQRWSDKSKC